MPVVTATPQTHNDLQVLPFAALVAMLRGARWRGPPGGRARRPPRGGGPRRGAGAAAPPAPPRAGGAAAGAGRRVRLTHRSPRGTETTRAVDPYGVVFHAGRWYVVGHDHLRGAVRTFRVDRIRDVGETGERFRRPEDFDAVEHLVRSLAAVPYPWEVEVVLHVDVDRARRLVPPTVGTVDEHPDGARLRVGAASLEWAARHLVWLAAPFTVVRPPELRDALRDLAAELAAQADTPGR
jgi:predicted DNA-binding transcriptional regulator YafY